MKAINNRRNSGANINTCGANICGANNAPSGGNCGCVHPYAHLRALLDQDCSNNTNNGWCIGQNLCRCCQDMCCLPICGFCSVITGDASAIDANSATIVNSCSFYNFSDTFQCGIEYSNDERLLNSTIIKSREASARFTVECCGLIPNTVYYYRAYVKYNNCIFYGQIRSFITQAQNCAKVKTSEAATVTPSSAVICGNCCGNVPAEIICRGIEYSIYEDMAICVEIAAPPVQPFDVVLTDLSPETDYYYRAFAQTPGERYRGEIKKFKTFV